MASRTPTNPEEKYKDKKGHENPLIDSHDVNHEFPLDEKSDSADKIVAAEQQASAPNKGVVGKKERNLAEQTNTGLYSRDGENSSQESSLARTKNFFARRKKRTIGGIIGAVVFGTGLGGFGIIQGPLQLMHLGQILQRPFSNQEEASESRTRGLLRFARSGNIGETRLSYLGSKSKNNTLKKFDEIGVKLEGDATTNKLKKVSIDLKKYPEFSELTNENAAKAIAEKYSIPPDQIKIDGNKSVRGGTLIIEADGTVLKDSIARSFLGDTITKAYGDARLGKLTSALKLRPVTTFYGSYSPWHPFKRASINLTQKSVDAFNTKRAAERTEKSPAAKTKLGGIREKLKPAAKYAGIAGFAQLGLCLAKDIAHDVPAANYASFIEPAQQSAADALAIRAQLETGQDFHISQPGAVAKGFKDENGKSIWQSQALQYLANGKNIGGEDLDPDIKRMFSPETSASNIEKALDDAGADSICSTTGQIVGGAVGVLGLVLAVPTGGGSAAAAFAFQAAVGAGAGIAAIAAITHIAKDLTAEEPLINKLHSGPLGGSVDAFGAMKLAEDASLKSGGTALSPPQSNALREKHEAREQAEFNSRSFVQRMFDVKDYRSTTSRIIDNPIMDPYQITTNVASAITNSNTWTSGLASIFTPKASAVGDGSYEWGFPEYGFAKEEVLENSIFEDPYENAELASGLISSNPSYVEKARKCFGVDIAADPGGRLAVKIAENPENDPGLEINPASAEYQEAKCNEGGDNWTRVRLFIFDTRTMDAYSCYEDNDTEACTQLGIIAAGSDTGETTVPTGTVGGNVQELAQQLLNLVDEGKVECGENDFGNDSADRSNPCQNLEDLADGKEAHTTQARTCTDGLVNAENETTTVEVELLQFMVEAAQSGVSYRINALVGQCHSGGSNHYSGKAVDFQCSPSDVGKLDEIAGKYGYVASNERCDNGASHYHYSPDGF